MNTDKSKPRPFDEKLLRELFGDKAVTAVNAHEFLIAALKATIEILESQGIECEIPKKALIKAKVKL